MPVQSLHKITFDPDNGGYVLLNFGDTIDADPDIPIGQQLGEVQPLESAFGYTYAMGGAMRSVTWVRYEDHTSHWAEKLHALSATELLPWGVTAPLQIEIQTDTDPIVLRMLDASIVDARPASPTYAMRTAIAYNVRGGRIIAVSGVPSVAGLPWGWLGGTWGDLTGTWGDL